MWAFASEPGSENWKGPYATKHEAISEALAYYGDTEDGFRPCVSRCRPVRPDDDHVGENWGWVCEGDVEEIEIVDSQNGRDEGRAGSA